MEKVLVEETLVFLIRGQEVLLARKTRHIGAGRWNGYGGGLEPDETLTQCVSRECAAEAGVRIALADLRKVAEVTFHNTKSDGSKFACLVHIFITKRWNGEPTESEEMTNPTWFPFDQLPFDEMMPADSAWVPLVLSGKKIIGEAHYSPFQQKLLRPVTITEVADFP